MKIDINFPPLGPLQNLLKCHKKGLIWMFHSRKSKNKISRIHERALRLTNND